MSIYQTINLSESAVPVMKSVPDLANVLRAGPIASFYAPATKSDLAEATTSAQKPVLGFEPLVRALSFMNES